MITSNIKFYILVHSNYRKENIVSQSTGGGGRNWNVIVIKLCSCKRHFTYLCFCVMLWTNTVCSFSTYFHRVTIFVLGSILLFHFSQTFTQHFVLTNWEDVAEVIHWSNLQAKEKIFVKEGACLLLLFPPTLEASLFDWHSFSADV